MSPARHKGVMVVSDGGSAGAPSAFSRRNVHGARTLGVTRPRIYQLLDESLSTPLARFEATAALGGAAVFANGSRPQRARRQPRRCGRQGGWPQPRRSNCEPLTPRSELAQSRVRAAQGAALYGLRRDQAAPQLGENRLVMRPCPWADAPFHASRERPSSVTGEAGRRLTL